MYLCTGTVCIPLQLVGVWVVNEWYKLGAPKPLQLVELGPGRGTLMQDVLRVSITEWFVVVSFLHFMS